jgi:hypothetical protein
MFCNLNLNFSNHNFCTANFIQHFFFQVLVLCARWEFRSEANKQQKGNDNKIVPSLENGNTKQIWNIKQIPGLPKNDEANHRGGLRTSLESSFNSFVSFYVQFVSNIFASIIICAFWVAFLFVCINVKTIIYLT